MLCTLCYVCGLTNVMLLCMLCYLCFVCMLRMLCCVCYIMYLFLAISLLSNVLTFVPFIWLSRGCLLAFDHSHDSLAPHGGDHMEGYVSTLPCMPYQLHALSTNQVSRWHGIAALFHTYIARSHHKLIVPSHIQNTTYRVSLRYFPPI
jgi:hypothetical protein